MRITLDEMFMEMLSSLEKRSTCLRRKVGAILTRDGMILSTGYNGSPRGIHNCETCLRKDLGIESGQRMEICMAVHAEQNCLMQCAVKQTNPNGSILYTSFSPCITCAKLIVQVGVKRVVYGEEYPDKLSFEILKEAKIEFNKF